MTKKLVKKSNERMTVISGVKKCSAVLDNKFGRKLMAGNLLVSCADR